MLNRIEVDHLWKRFRLRHKYRASLKRMLLEWHKNHIEPFWALSDVSFTVQPGESVAVIGRNTSGKSTLLAILSRVYKPTQGKVSVQGRIATLLELGAGFHHELTGIENIELNGAILGLRRKEIEKKMDSIIGFAGLEQFIDAPLKTYSSGMIMRLGFSIAVHADADVVLIDEVLAVGDEAFQMKCYETVRDFKRQGKTTILVSHDMNAVRAVCERSIWLDKGVVKADGPTNDVVARYVATAH